jgi:cytochrome c553
MHTVRSYSEIRQNQQATAQDIPTLPGKDLEPVSPESVLPLARVCESCHGQDGQSTRDEVPVIAGKPAAEIVAALEAFYYFERHCPKVDYENAEGAIESRSMCDITNELNQQEALALARYFEAAGNGSGQ